MYLQIHIPGAHQLHHYQLVYYYLWYISLVPLSLQLSQSSSTSLFISFSHPYCLPPLLHPILSTTTPSPYTLLLPPPYQQPYTLFHTCSPSSHFSSPSPTPSIPPYPPPCYLFPLYCSPTLPPDTLTRILPYL